MDVHKQERRCKYVEKKKLETVMFAPALRVRSKMGDENDKVEGKEAVQDSPVEEAGEVKKAEQEEPSEAEEGPKESTGEKE